MNQILPVVLLVLLLGFEPLAVGQPSPVVLPPPNLDGAGSLQHALQQRRSTREFSDKELSMQELSSILWCAAGINRPATGHRTVPSAMNRQDIDVFVFLKNGAYLYDAAHHALQPVVGGDVRKYAGTQDFVARAPLNLVYVSDFSKLDFTADDNEKGIMAGVEVGHSSENVYLYGAAANLGVVVRAYFNKSSLRELLKLRPSQHPIIAQTVGHLRESGE